jgi:beta-lactamase regulating signal transducer with metallopeptidase domain
MLTRASHLDSSRNIWIVESEWPLALASGIPHARVFISSKLVHSLSPPQLTAVLAHERAHLHRHDPTRYFMARIMSYLHVSWLRQKLLEDLSLAVEQSCDEEAAKEVGDRLLVADTIVQVERLLNKQFPSMPALLPSFMGSHVVVRVESLLASPREQVPVHQIMSHVCVGLAVVALMLAAEPLHQLTEAVLGLLIG